MVKLLTPVVVIAALTVLLEPRVRAEEPDQSLQDTTSSALLDDANYFFYSGAYEAPAALALHVRTRDVVNLEASEPRTAALHFQIRRALGTPKDRGKAWQECDVCQELMPLFLDEFNLGRDAARDVVADDPADDETLFLLGKLDLNYVWLQLAAVGRKTGWGEFREAREALKTVLERRPDHIRARVAQAWIDYIVATSLPPGTRWLIGGGNKKRGLLAVEQAAQADAAPYVSAEARFALWDMRAREKNFDASVITARALLEDFPDNRQLVKFIARHEGEDEQVGPVTRRSSRARWRISAAQPCGRCRARTCRTGASQTAPGRRRDARAAARPWPIDSEAAVTRCRSRWSPAAVR
jgi:hypothetical protein